MNLYDMPIVRDEVEASDVRLTTLSSIMQLSSNWMIGFNQPLLKPYDESNIQFLSNVRFSQEILPNSVPSKEKILEYLKNIGTSDSTLIIIDSYLFPMNGDSNYKELITDILKQSKAKNIKVITREYDYKGKKIYNETLCKNVSEKLDIQIEVNFSYEFHDRFWITDKNKGFTIGTSLNGISNKVTRIDELREDEVKAIMAKLPQ